MSIVLRFYDEDEKQSPLFQALNRVILPHRHPHREWEYPKVLVELGATPLNPSMLCVGVMWDSLALYLAPLCERFVGISLEPEAQLVAWFGATDTRHELLSGPAEVVIPKFYDRPTFDYTFCISTLEHIEPIARKVAWESMLRVTRYRVVATVDFTPQADRWDVLDWDSLSTMLDVDARQLPVSGLAPEIGEWYPLAITVDKGVG